MRLFTTYFSHTMYGDGYPVWGRAPGRAADSLHLFFTALHGKQSTFSSHGAYGIWRASAVQDGTSRLTGTAHDTFREWRRAWRAG